MKVITFYNVINFNQKVLDIDKISELYSYENMPFSQELSFIRSQIEKD